MQAFKSGDKQVVEQLLPRIRPAVVRTTFHAFMFHQRFSISNHGSQPLLHLAAYWGWKDITILLVTDGTQLRSKLERR